MSPEAKRFYIQPENKELEPDIRTAIIYAGQGQNLQNLRSRTIELRQHPTALAVFDESDKILYDEFPNRFNEGFSPIILNGSEDLLRQNQQLLVLLYNLACTRVLEQQRDEDGFRFPPKSNIVAVSGQSLGLISAIVASRAIDFPNMIRLGIERQDAMQEANAINPGTQVALLASDSDERIKRLMDAHVLEISIITGSNLVVLGGSIDAVKEVVKEAKTEKIRVFELETDGAFHTSLMKPAAERLTQALLNITIKDAQINVIANTTGKSIHTSRQIKREIINQLTNPVLWLQSTDFMSNQVDQFLEIGNDGLLTNIIKRDMENRTGEKDSLVKRLLQASGVAANAIGAALIIHQPLKGNPL